MAMAEQTRNLPESLSGIETNDGELINPHHFRPEIYPNPFQGLKRLYLSLQSHSP